MAGSSIHSSVFLREGKCRTSQQVASQQYSEQNQDSTTWESYSVYIYNYAYSFPGTFWSTLLKDYLRRRNMPCSLNICRFLLICLFQPVCLFISEPPNLSAQISINLHRRMVFECFRVVYHNGSLDQMVFFIERYDLADLSYKPFAG